MANKNVIGVESGAYTKFGESVAKKWVAPPVIPLPPEPAPTTVQFVPPYPPMYKAVKEVRLEQSTGLHQHNTAFTVEPIKGLHLLVHVSSDNTAVDDNDILNGLTEVLNFIHRNYIASS